MAENLTPGVGTVHSGDTVIMKPDPYFSKLQRPASPNHWLIAPADFALRPDAVAPLFDVPVAVLRAAFHAVVRATPGAVVAGESADGMHVVATTRWLAFKDDIRVLFIPVTQQQSTIVLYSASRVGYWDLGANRRRLADWLSQTRNALAKRGP